MHPKINFLSLIPSFQHKSKKTNLNNNVIHFHGCKVKAPKVKFCASFKCFFHYFKSSAEAILSKEPPPAVKQHFWQICPEFISSSVISLTERLWGKCTLLGTIFFLIQNHFISNNTMIQLRGRTFVIYKLLVIGSK